MSHFSLETELASALRLDGPINRGPAMRWQRKQGEEGNQSVNMSLNASCGLGKTPVKTASINNKSMSKTPSSNGSLGYSHKTPKSGGKKTPGKGAKTPNGGDRFIPNRSTTQFDLGHFMINQDTNSQQQSENAEMMSPSKLEYQKVMSENLNGDLASKKIISYKGNLPNAPEGHQSSLQVLYSTCKTPASTAKKTIRNIPQVPERILDAPEILDDYYLNLLDWSVNNHLAVALGNHVYLWNAATGEINQLLQLDGPEDYIGAVAWVAEGNILGVGTSAGEVQLWDVAQQKRLRNMAGHAARVGSLSWNSYVVSSGSRSGAIHHHDVRVAQHHVGTFTGHSQEVCGLQWSPDGKHLASGGNDNLLNVWTAQNLTASPSAIQPVHTFSQHLAAVKAVSWCPWQHNVLASGGGTADRHIRFWNVSVGSCINAVDTKSQVCALQWSKEYKELVSSHGFALNQLTIWKYPAMTKVAELTGHTSRVLHMAMSPDGTTVVSAGADETLRLWKCFSVDKEKKKSQKSSIVPRDQTIAHLSKIR
ncbi:cell division cycle protein 20 homolog [Mya arenaria]|uniref:cell division cycle protein 20 homolog n=1 Tax=Mya arenaria TaxID=6604 RepID=UPI0022DF047C|nr:cell division cycle protein 20 homolog [Mya arenaria]XP_052774450.1 cell division cycle protein 20 homolog [Mya arenaria]XP_052774553.1 cell division cycle protein 20 homolog [Mya arenaria]XP_052774554.1 cell division cycle protein 20 homolog [Mya arenaria]